MAYSKKEYKVVDKFIDTALQPCCFTRAKDTIETPKLFISRVESAYKDV